MGINSLKYFILPFILYLSFVIIIAYISFIFSSMAKKPIIKAIFTAEVKAKRRPRIWLLLLLGVFALVPVELGLRSVGFGHVITYVKDARVGFYLTPNQKTRWFRAITKTNQFGMRAPERRREKSPGIKRILMLGDSTLWGGVYIDQEDIYARRLEHLLNKQGLKAEIFNVGVNAWGPFHERAYVESFGTFDADVAVVCLPVCDLFRSFYGLESTPFTEVRNPPVCALENFFYILTWKYRAWRLGFPRNVDRPWLLSRGIEEYAKLASLLRDSGCEVFFEILPSKLAATYGVPEDEAQSVAALRAKLEANGFAVDFPAGLFKGHAEQKGLYKDSVHLGRLGHKLYAEYLLRHLCKLSRVLQE